MNKLQDCALFLASLLFVGCGDTNNDGFSTTEGLKETFRTTFEAGDMGGLMDSPLFTRDSDCSQS